jgi:Na+-translocating ferredoxin:NAD+ oxidoreductase RnfE subunit
MGVSWLVCVTYSKEVASALRFGVKDGTRTFVNVHVIAVIATVYKFLIAVI